MTAKIPIGHILSQMNPVLTLPSGFFDSHFNIILPSSPMPRYLLQFWFLLVLFFDPENGGDIFIRNVG
jgi:hypothetical protein